MTDNIQQIPNSLEMKPWIIIKPYTRFMFSNRKYTMGLLQSAKAISLSMMRSFNSAQLVSLALLFGLVVLSFSSCKKDAEALDIVPAI